MTPASGQPERYTVHCLHCPQTFDVPNLAGPSNKPVMERAYKIIETLSAHIQRKHPAQWQNLAASQAVLIAALFTHEDPVFNALVEKVKEVLQEPVKV
jgi:hypothetical protein